MVIIGGVGALFFPTQAYALPGDTVTITSPQPNSIVGSGCDVTVVYSLANPNNQVSEWIFTVMFDPWPEGPSSRIYQESKSMTVDSGTVSFHVSDPMGPASSYTITISVDYYTTQGDKWPLVDPRPQISVYGKDPNGAAVNTDNSPQKSGGSPVGFIIGGAALIAVIGGLITIIRRRAPVKTPPGTTPPGSISNKSVLPPGQNPPGNKTTPPAGPKRPQSNKAIAEAEDALSKAKKNAALFEKWTRLRQSASIDPRLSEFVDKARASIIGPNGEVNEANLNRLDFLLKNWIKRDIAAPQTPDYTYSDAYFDTVRSSTQGVGGITIRIGAGILTGGYSEMAFNPISALSTMHDGIMQGDSTGMAVAKGFGQSGFELALGESNRIIKPLTDYGKSAYNSYKLGQLSAGLKSDISTVSQLASQTEGQLTRNAFMKSSEIATAGENSIYKLTSAEQEALRINNSAEYRSLMSNNSELLPNDFKEVLGTAKQKAYEQARNNAVDDVMQQMAKDGIDTSDKTFLLQQTGTHAQPGNPGWNAAKSDFDHTVDFGSARYNSQYEQALNSHLEAQGTSAKALDANVYGEGTSSHGAYTGGAQKFVQHYDETSGSQAMIRNIDGNTVITRETPQTSTSLLSRMNPDDVNSAHANYQNFFEKDVAKGADLNNQIINGSKTVSRDAGQYSAKYVQNYQQTGSVNYEPPPAAKVADLIKKQGMSVNDAMNKVGYGGGKEQLLNDYKNIMGK